MLSVVKIILSQSTSPRWLKSLQKKGKGLDYSTVQILWATNLTIATDFKAWREEVFEVSLIEYIQIILDFFMKT